MSLNKTKIDWCDYTINPIKGLCKNDCWYCYAKRMYRRFNWNPKIRIDEKEFNKLNKIKKSSTFFVCSMIDLFGNWICDDWIYYVLEKIKQYPQHRFYILSKFPERMSHWQFPPNCWIGVTVTGEEGIFENTGKLDFLLLASRSNKNTHFISFEPLLGRVSNLINNSIDWIIVGGLTPKPIHKKEWVEDIIHMARYWRVPIFIKNNLKWPEKIQEFPK